MAEGLVEIIISRKYLKAIQALAGRAVKTEEPDVYFVSKEAVDFLKTTSVLFTIVKIKEQGGKK